ncbi:MAG: sensor histidine kinase [Marmoricola sp.]
MLYTLTAASLAWRRLAPAQVLAFIVVADTLEYVTFGAPEGLGSLLPTVVAFFAVGRYARAGALTVAGPLALLGIVVHELRDPVFQLSGSNAVFYGVVAAAWPIGYAFRIRADQAAVLRLERDRAEAQRLVAAEQAIDAERTRISRELHDIVGHGLSVLVLQQVGASAALDNDMLGEARRLVTDGERVARETLAEMRRLLVLLGDEPAADLPPGLHDIDRLVRDARSAGAQVSVTVMGTPTDLSPGLDLTAFRILQEGLTNVLKHAQPPECEIEIRYEGDHLSVAVIDHGQGAAESRPGRGLSGMAERANVFGGTLTHGPTAAGGFAVCARLPVRT